MDNHLYVEDINDDLTLVCSTLNDLLLLSPILK